MGALPTCAGNQKPPKLTQVRPGVQNQEVKSENLS